jgi:sterol 14-demethylase
LVCSLFPAGKTTCLGTRLAKIELKLTVALFLLGFDHVLVSDDGNTPTAPPKPNWNDILQCRPAHGACSVKYTRTAFAL